MSWFRMWCVIQRVWTGLYRDKRALPALILLPLGTMLLIGYVMRAADDDLTIALVVTADEWQVREASIFVEESFDHDGVEHTRIESLGAADEQLRDGDIDAYIVLDDAFVRGVLSSSQEEIRVGLRGDSQSDTTKALVAISHALSEAPLRVLNATLGAEPEPGQPLDLDEHYVFAGDKFDSLDHTLPALIAFASFLSIFTVAVVAFTQERFTRTMERMLSTAATRAEIVLGYALAYAAEAAVQTALILGIVVIAFDADFAGSLALIAAITMLGALSALMLGILLSAFARTEQQAMQALPFVLVPQLVLAGVLFPLESLPEGLQVVAHAMPLTYSVDALRDVMIRGFDLSNPSVLLNVAVLSAFAAGFAALGIRSLRESA